MATTPSPKNDVPEDDDEFTDVSQYLRRRRWCSKTLACISLKVEDVMPDSPILPGQQTPTAFNLISTQTPRASTRSTSSDSIRRHPRSAKEEAFAGIRRPRFAPKTSFQEVRYRRNNVQRSDVGERDQAGNGFHTKGLAPRPIDFATIQLNRNPRGQQHTKQAPSSASSLNRYSLLDGSAPFDNDFSSSAFPGPLTRDHEIVTSSTLISPPVLTRKATYSSLPPSPSSLSLTDFDLDVTGPRSADGDPSHLDIYDQIDQEAFAKALQKVLESKKDVVLESQGLPDRKSRAASLPLEDILTDRPSSATEPTSNPFDTHENDSLKAVPPMLRTASRTRSNHGTRTPTRQISTQAVPTTPAQDHTTSNAFLPPSAEAASPLQPLWQMIRDEMNVEENRFFVIEGKW
jgi:hypothetical protein